MNTLIFCLLFRGGGVDCADFETQRFILNPPSYFLFNMSCSLQHIKEEEISVRSSTPWRRERAPETLVYMRGESRPAFQTVLCWCSVRISTVIREHCCTTDWTVIRGTDTSAGSHARPRH